MSEVVDPASARGPDLGSVISRRWIFTQSHPLQTSDLQQQFKRRGLDLDARMLRELYLRGHLRPLLEVTSRRASVPIPSHEDDPPIHGTTQYELRTALAAGRFRDLTVGAPRPRLRFDQPPNADMRWWNGLVYSTYQVLAVPWLRGVVSRARWRGPRDSRRPVLPECESWMLSASRVSRIALALTALEARYRPSVQVGWIQLTNAEPDHWRDYREAYDCVSESLALNYPAAVAQDDAEWLLMQARGFDPMGPWSQLVARTAKRQWEKLTGDAAVALDYRLAAEMLLLYVEDLASQSGVAPPAPPVGSMLWHPLHDRLSAHEPLDELLYELGVSPHPRVVLVLEGESEEFFAHQLQELLGYKASRDYVRILRMDGVDKKLEMLAAFVAAPALGEFRAGAFELARPPAEVHVAVDPEGRFATPARAEAQRQRLLEAIRRIVRVQGAQLQEQELDRLVTIRTWGGACVEFEHFTDSELVAALRVVHSNCGGLNDAELGGALRDARQARRDIKSIWRGWDRQPSKVELAKALWPELERKVNEAISSGSEPPALAQVVDDAHNTALALSRGRYVVEGVPIETG